VRTILPSTSAASAAVTLALALLAGGAAANGNRALAQKKAKDGVKVLLLSGGQRQHHGYREQALYLSGLLEDTGRYETTIVEDAAVLLTPAMARYQILVVNADRRDPEFKFTAAQQKALLDWVKSGRGYVSIHGADNAAPDWLPEWRDMLGGVFTHVGLPDGKVRKGTYAVKIAKSDHPVTHGLSDFELKDELYYHMQMKPDVEPLATVRHEDADWPVAWTRTFGDGRVFHTPLGHRDFGPGKDDPLRNPNLSKLVVQGVDWVASGLPGAGRPASAAGR
jgi:type 1 glutamine amidotransferase